MEIVATIKARMGSKRLPGKVLKRLDGMSIRDISYRRVI
jgi:spore coat polysaccharide biosynthesis protein SpsF (cytidylyltransferase family)|tara:strand:- start:5 stop:121 length:117 start_codon:yes stop_codon:yes gene_type:complete